MKSPTPFPVALSELGLIGMILVTILLGSIMTSILQLDFDQIFNLLEGIFWISIAIIFAWRAFKTKAHKNLLFGTSITFLLFGISDFIEIYTRAWYLPWSLFALKAACVVSLISLLIFYLRLKHREKINRPHADKQNHET